MTRDLIFLLLGLGLGGAYSIMALGVVSVYRATGVPNFAQGAIAMIAAFSYFNLRGSMSTWAALAATLAIGAAIGILFYLLVMRQLRNSPLMAQIAATIAFLMLLHGLALVVFPLASTTPPSILPQNFVHIGNYGIPIDRFIVAGIALVAAILLEIVARRTRFGLATRAQSESEKGVILIGWSPVLLASANWAISCVLAAVAGIVLSPIAGFDQDALTLLVVPVFAAALLARFTSYPRAVFAGFGLGMAQSVLQLYSAPGHWYYAILQGPGRADAFPALVVFVAMLFSGKLIPQRDVVLRGRLPSSAHPRNLRYGLPILVAAGIAMSQLLPLNWVAALTVSLTATVIGASLVLVTGIGGQISLAQLAFAGLGAFISARVAVEGVGFVPGILLAGFTGAVLGFVVGLPSLRVRGPSLAVMTLAIALALYDFVFTNGELMGPNSYLQFGGFPKIAGWATDQRSFAILCVVAAAAALVIVSLIRRSRFGLGALLVRESERSAIIAGISVTRQKLAVFVISASMAAIGGALIAHAQLVFSYESYNVIQSLLLFVTAYIGGIGMASGAVIAGLGATGGIFSNLLSLANITRYQELIAGGVLLIALQIHPDGMATLPETFRQVIRRRRATRSSAVDNEGPALDQEVLAGVSSSVVEAGE